MHSFHALAKPSSQQNGIQKKVQNRAYERIAEMYYYDNKVTYYNKIECVFDWICMCDTVESNHGHHIYILILYSIRLCTSCTMQSSPHSLRVPHIFFSKCIFLSDCAVYISIALYLSSEFVFIIICLCVHYTFIFKYINCMPI